MGSVSLALIPLWGISFLVSDPYPQPSAWDLEWSRALGPDDKASPEGGAEMTIPIPPRMCGSPRLRADISIQVQLSSGLWAVGM